MVPIPTINAANLVLGPADLYAGAFGSTEPLDSSITPNGVTTPPSTPPWTYVGGTDGGVSVEIDTTYTDLTVDQVIMNVGARLTDMKMTVTTKLSEMTLANLNLVLNNIATTSTGSGYETLDVPVGSAATQPAYTALIVDGWGPTLNTGQPARRRIVVRKVLSQVKVSMMFDKKGQASYDCTFNAYFVSSGIAPIHLVDQQA